MSSLSRQGTKSRVLRDVSVVAPADLGQVTARVARTLVVSPELIEGAIRDGNRSGYDDGYATGYADGLAEARARTEDLAARLAGLFPNSGKPRRRSTAREATARIDIEDQVISVAFEIAQVLLGHELTHTEQRGRDALARALAFAPEQGHVLARLHPDDLAAIGDAAELAPGRSLALVPDAGLRPGDCVIDVAGCRIDARLDSTIERIRAVLDPNDQDVTDAEADYS